MLGAGGRTAGVGGSTGRGGGTGGSGNAGSGGIAGAGGGAGAGGATGSGGAAGAGGKAGTGGRAGGAGASGAAGAGGAVGGGGKAGTGGQAGGAGAGAGGAAQSTYDQTILGDQPVAYWAVNKMPGSEPDLTGNNNTGTYKGGSPATASLPNGDAVADFNGSTQYLTVPSNASLSIPTTGNLTWEAWIRPDVLQFTITSGGYVDWMGKCASYSPTCEWEARMYNLTNSETRPSRLSAYVFNTSAGLGSAADWQPMTGVIQAGQWYHVVGEYTTLSQPSDCTSASTYPGSINIWVNGVEWDHSSHGQTGCMSQYSVIPKASTSPLNIGTMATDTWFQGAIGKVAIYNHLLTPTQITNHYHSMTGQQPPAGSCADMCSL
jgi:hypothetical protein